MEQPRENVPMKILVLCEGSAETWDSWSGITKSVVDHLRAAGHTVYTGDVDLYGGARWRTLARVFSPNLRRWRARFRLSGPAFRHRSAIAAKHIAAHRDIDIILQIGATFTASGSGRIPYVLYCDSNIRMAEHGIATGHSHAVPLNADERRGIIERESSVYESAAAIFTISERLRQSFVEDFGIPGDRVHTIYAGPNFDPSHIPPPRTESRTPSRTILFVGKQFERKGGDVLVKAFREVRRTMPDARLVIVGPKKLDLGEEPGITFVGELDKRTVKGREALVEAYRSADVFCLPTRFEPFGIVFLEAMYFGLPCVGTRAWAVPEMVVDGETGYTVEVDDVAMLTHSLLRLLDDPALARKMGKAGRTRAESHFTWPAVVGRMTTSIENVLAKGSVCAA
jgi:glycosyltransferase involved in cell wall biosynthesis